MEARKPTLEYQGPPPPLARAHVRFLFLKVVWVMLVEAAIASLLALIFAFTR